jgi:LysM repeat protein
VVEQPVAEVPATPAPEPALEAEAPAAAVTPEVAAPETPEASEEAVAGAPLAGVEVGEGLVRIEHVVSRGEILSRLAKQYGVKQSDIEKWNKLSNPNVQRGQRLVLFVDPDAASGAAEADPVPAAVPEAAAPAAEDSQDVAPVEAEVGPEAAAEYERYRVKPGDTATRLAREHGISVKELLRMNGIDDADRILVDQVIKVPK